MWQHRATSSTTHPLQFASCALPLARLMATYFHMMTGPHHRPMYMPTKKIIFTMLVVSYIFTIWLLPAPSTQKQSRETQIQAS